MNKTGARNLITDVPGIYVGNAEDEAIRSGVTIVLPDAPAVAAVDCRGGGTGTREIDVLRAENSATHIHAIVLSGGSSFGLDAASGVMAWLAAKERGFSIAGHIVPIVPAAILFDLANGGDKSWVTDLDMPTPYRALGLRAITTAQETFALGNIGAGYGATAGPLKGGLGSASVMIDDGIAVGALAAVNAFGSAVMPKAKTFWSWPFERDNELGGQMPPTYSEPVDLDYGFDFGAGKNTTLAVVATDANLTRGQALRVAVMAQDGIARAIRPVHTPVDGDTVFVLATAKNSAPIGLDQVARIGTAAADCLARAVARGVYEAGSLWGIPGYETL